MEEAEGEEEEEGRRVEPGGAVTCSEREHRGDGRVLETIDRYFGRYRSLCIYYYVLAVGCWGGSQITRSAGLLLALQKSAARCSPAGDMPMRSGMAECENG